MSVIEDCEAVKVCRSGKSLRIEEMARRLFYTDHHVMPLPAGHKFPIEKYRLLREMLERDGRFVLERAPLAAEEVIELAHDRDYVRAFVNGTLGDAAMRRIGFPWSEGLVQRTLASVGSTLAATAEGLVVGKKLGLDPNVMTDVLNVSTGMSWITQTHIKQRITNRAFDDPFKLELMVKDIGIALELARRESANVPFWSLGQEIWRAADEEADHGASVSELVRHVERVGGATIEP